MAITRSIMALMRLQLLGTDRKKPSTLNRYVIRFIFGSVFIKYPDISTSTVEITLAALLKEGYIIKTGAGKNTAYVRNHENKGF